MLPWQPKLLAYSNRTQLVPCDVPHRWDYYNCLGFEKIDKLKEFNDENLTLPSYLRGKSKKLSVTGMSECSDHN